MADLFEKTASTWRQLALAFQVRGILLRWCRGRCFVRSARMCYWLRGVPACKGQKLRADVKDKFGRLGGGCVLVYARAPAGVHHLGLFPQQEFELGDEAILTICEERLCGPVNTRMAAQ